MKKIEYIYNRSRLHPELHISPITKGEIKALQQVYKDVSVYDYKLYESRCLIFIRGVVEREGVNLG
jgi:hypothetical protein